MATVYYLKMNDDNQVKNLEFIDPVPGNFPKELKKGDLCFVRASGEYTPSALKRLWEFLEFVDNSDGSRTAKFKPHWEDDHGNELYFDPLELLGKFTALNWFCLNLTMTNYIHKQQKGKSFFPLTIVKQEEFDNAIKSVANFNSYTANPDNYRKVEVVSTFDSSSENIQLSKDANNEYSLYPANFIDKTTLIDLFDGKKPNEYGAMNPSRYQLGTAKGKMYLYLEKGVGDYSLLGFYDLFCTQVPLKTTRKKGSSTISTAKKSDNDVMLDTDLLKKNNDSVDGYDYEDSQILHGGENLIIYGTPGCGKSHALNERLNKEFSETNQFRVTFHQDYTYTDFVGQILPCVTEDDKVKYEFIPGPFTLALSKAIENLEEKVALVIEEINRGNAASIFGDLFQLLDRDENGTSIYELTNVQITRYLKKEFEYSLDYIKIPANLSIYATMNTGDQNVFTLDTAFKRRWNFEKLSNIFNKDDVHGDRYLPGMNNVTWENFVTTINNQMIKEGTFDSEDKQLGKYFVTNNQLVDYAENDNSKAKKFAHKVLEYLWNDVAKFNREKWFNIEKYKTLDDVLAAWINGEGEKIFSKEISFDVTTPLTSVPDMSSVTSDESEEKGDEE